VEGEGDGVGRGEGESWEVEGEGVEAGVTLDTLSLGAGLKDEEGVLDSMMEKVGVGTPLKLRTGGSEGWEIVEGECMVETEGAWGMVGASVMMEELEIVVAVSGLKLVSTVKEGVDSRESEGSGVPVWVGGLEKELLVLGV